MLKMATTWWMANWQKATCWALAAVMFITFDQFYQVVLARDVQRDEGKATPPLDWTAPAKLEQWLARTLAALDHADAKRLAAQRDEFAKLRDEAERLLESRWRSIEDAKLGLSAMENHRALATDFRERSKKVLAALDAALDGSGSETLGALKTRLAEFTTRPVLETLGGRLPRSMREAPSDLGRRRVEAYLPTDTIRDITLGQSFPEATGNPVAADTAGTLDAPLAPEITAKATELGNNPVRIFEFVRNSVRTEPTYGSIKGAVETLRSMSGNDTDQASLLVALLRAANIPARYVYGTVEVGMADLLGALAVTDPSKAVEVLAKNDVPFLPIVAGGTFSAVRIDRTWVRAWVDYNPHRGAETAAPERFIDLDPSFKRQTLSPYRNVAGEAGFDAQAFLNAIKNRPGLVTDATSVKGVDDAFIQQQLDSFSGKIDNFLHGNKLTTASAHRTVEIEQDVLGHLPVSRAYSVTATGAAYAELPSTFRYKVVVKLLNENGSTAFSHPTTTVALAGKRLTVGAKGATAADDAAIASNQSSADFPVYLVKVTPQLLVDGVAVSTGPAVAMGATQTIRVEFTTAAATKTGLSEILLKAGERAALVFDLGRVGAKHLDEARAKLDAALAAIQAATPPVTDAAAGQLLHSVGLNHLYQADTLADITADTLDVVWSRPEPALIVVRHQMTVTPLLGLPFTAKADSVTLDLKREILAVSARSGAGSTVEKRFFLTTAMTGSALEGTSLSSFFLSQGASTVSLLRQGNLAAKKTVTITSSSQLGLIAHPDDVESEIGSLADAGFAITVTESPSLVGTIQLSGFIALDPLLNSSAFVLRLTPQIAGGVAFTTQVKAGDLVAPTAATSFSPLLSAGSAWLKSAASATSDAGLRYIPAIDSISA